MASTMKDKEKETEVRLYDVRNVERNIKRGVISRKDYEKWLKALPDSKDKIGQMPELHRVTASD
jgi:hypothetical protein